jgi:hypothetical protein
MNKAKTGKALAAAAIANLAVAGFAAAPAGAATHAKVGATTTTVVGSQARGFVPKSGGGVRPDGFESNCAGNVCIGASVSNGQVSKENQHFFNYSGCHIASWYYINAKGEKGPSHHNQTCYHSEQHYGFGSVTGNYARGVICAGFWNVPGKACVSV